MVGLVLAGEAVFSLPFHVTRYFRPTFLDVFGFSNSDLGRAQAAYGVVAMVAYFPGGPLADRFPARILLVVSLLLTAGGGLYMATIPSVTGMALLWAFWGGTTILLLWAALIRATREWGGTNSQGRAFGILDGGRGLVSALLAFFAAQAFTVLMPDNPEAATSAERLSALQNIIYTYVAATAGTALFVWFALPQGSDTPAKTSATKGLWAHVAPVVRMPAIWLQAVIVVTAYVAYKGTDNYGLFARDVYGLDEVESAWISTVSAWVRPVAALAAGWLADRVLSSRVVSGCFSVLVVTFSVLALAPPTHGVLAVLVIEIVVACIAVYGLRGVYFALFEEAAVPRAVTGTAVGIVSVVGYTPDIFVGLVSGHLLDTYPGLPGHRYFFLFLATTAALGFLASVSFARIARTQRATQSASSSTASTVSSQAEGSAPGSP